MTFQCKSQIICYRCTFGSSKQLTSVPQLQLITEITQWAIGDSRDINSSCFRLAKASVVRAHTYGADLEIFGTKQKRISATMERAKSLFVALLSRWSLKAKTEIHWPLRAEVFSKIQFWCRSTTKARKVRKNLIFRKRCEETRAPGRVFRNLRRSDGGDL